MIDLLSMGCWHSRCTVQVHTAGPQNLPGNILHVEIVAWGPYQTRKILVVELEMDEGSMFQLVVMSFTPLLSGTHILWHAVSKMT